MRRLRGVALLGAAVLLATGCSDDDEATQGSASPTTVAVTSSAPTSVVATTVAGATTTVAGATTTRPPGAASSAPTTAASAATGPVSAEAGGWRLVVTAPTGGSTIGPVTTLCYEATGQTREPDLALEATLVPPGATSGGQPVRAGAAVGRGSVRIDFGGVTPGRYDLRVQGIVNGQRLDGLAVTVRAVTLGTAAPRSCP